MSTPKNTLLFYSNLPSGGAKNTMLSTAKYLNRFYRIQKISDPKYKISNFFQYMFTALFSSPKFQKRAIELKRVFDILIVYQSWLVKTPDIIRYSDKPKIYICHDSLREYYDHDHIAAQSFKDKVVNLLRLPIKWRDKKNISSNNLTIITNSHYSKEIIRKAYDRDSLVIYPGINTSKYLSDTFIDKKDQIISVGAINKFKRQSFYVDVVGQIPANRRPTLVLIGNGADKQYLSLLKSKALKNSVTLKIFLNATEYTKINELRKSKAYIYAPVSEPFGLSVVEALSVGLPIVAYKYGGGYAEIITNKSGIIMDALDTKTWANEVQKLLSDNNYGKYYNYNKALAKTNFDEKRMNTQIHKLIQQAL